MSHSFIIVICAMLVSGFDARANLRSEESSRKVHRNGVEVIMLNQDFAKVGASELSRDGYNVHSAWEKAPSREDEVPDPSVRDMAFAEAGLTAAITEWDHFDRDGLYIRAKIFEIDRLMRVYPKLPGEPLKRLKRILAKKRREGKGS